VLNQPVSAAAFLRGPVEAVAAQLTNDSARAAGLIGRRLGVYQLLGFLDAGGMGRSIAPATRSWGARWRSKSCRAP
jgi:hypothetical protein